MYPELPEVFFQAQTQNPNNSNLRVVYNHVFDVNITSVTAVSNAFIPLKRSEDTRVINVVIARVRDAADDGPTATYSSHFVFGFQDGYECLDSGVAEVGDGCAVPFCLSWALQDRPEWVQSSKRSSGWSVSHCGAGN